MLVCARWVWRVHKSYMGPHISRLNVVHSTDTRSRMLNMFYRIRFPHVKKVCTLKHILEPNSKLFFQTFLGSQPGNYC